MKPAIRKDILEDYISEGESLNSSIVYEEEYLPSDILLGNWPSFKAWGVSIVNYLSTVVEPNNGYLKSLNRLLLAPMPNGADLITAISTLKQLLKDVDKGIFAQANSSLEALLPLGLIFDRFELVVRQLRKRYTNRHTLDVADEYDVQDLLYALLRLYFDDIQPEDYVPKFAGKGSRCDFVLRDHNIIVEVKKTRNNLRDKEVGEELILDIAKYSKYPDVKQLVCFIYDPDGYINNVKGLETDLGGMRDGIDVHIFIRPK